MLKIPPANSMRWEWVKWFFVSVGLLGFYGFYVSVFIAFIKFGYIYGLNLGEAPLSQAIRFLHEGRMPYHELTEPPFSLVPYGIVYPLVVAPLHYLTSLPLLPGRIVTFVSTLGACLFIFLILKRSGVKFFASSLAVSLFMAHPYVRRWGVQVNVDMAAVMLSLVSVYFLNEYVKSTPRKSWQLIAGISIAVLAFFTKASALACPGAFFWYLVYRREWRLLISFSLSMGLSILMIYAGLNLWTNGQYYFHTAYEISQRLFFPQFIYRYWLMAAKISPLLVAASLIFLLRPLFLKQNPYLYLYVLFSVLVTFSLGKQGSDTNYHLEWCATSSMALAFILNRWIEKKAVWKSLIGSFLIAVQLIQLTPYWDPLLKSERKDYTERTAFFDNISEMIRKTPGPIISWDMALLVANGREIYYECFPMAQMAYSGVWDDTPILRDLDQKKFGLVILYFYANVLRADRNFTERFLNVFKSRYHLVGRAVIPAQKGPPPHDALFFYVPNE